MLLRLSIASELLLWTMVGVNDTETILELGDFIDTGNGHYPMSNCSTLSCKLPSMW